MADPQPSRGHRYRYPEEAKRLITEMLQDIEDRQIIEKSTSAWLSPIVLVNKPDESKRMCLDYRHVNKHLATDIYPLPRLEELETKQLVIISMPHLTCVRPIFKLS